MVTLKTLVSVFGSCHYSTSNVTTVTKVWSASFGLVLHMHHIVYISFVCEYVVSPDECYYTLLCCEGYFSSTSVVSHSFSALCVYSKCGHNLHPLNYLCAKFHFFCDLRCWASPWRKIAYSITRSISQSLTRPAQVISGLGTEACASELDTMYSYTRDICYTWCFLVSSAWCIHFSYMFGYGFWTYVIKFVHIFGIFYVLLAQLRWLFWNCRS